jgi:hypothetical protein
MTETIKEAYDRLSKSYDPILMGLIRRVAPKLAAYDLCGVQPMTGPTGLIFTLNPSKQMTIKEAYDKLESF